MSNLSDKISEMEIGLQECLCKGNLSGSRNYSSLIDVSKAIALDLQEVRDRLEALESA